MSDFRLKLDIFKALTFMMYLSLQRVMVLLLLEIQAFVKISL